MFNTTKMGEDASWLAVQLSQPVRSRMPTSFRDVQFDIDNTTLALLGMLLATLLYSRFSRPSPLVHPLLLGKQSEVSIVRKKGETGIYRSFATGQGTPLTVRPANTLKTVQDIIQPSKDSAKTQRIICDTPLTNEALQELVRLVPLGLRSLFPDLSADAAKATTPIATLIPPSPTTALPQTLLALASAPSIPLIPLSSPSFLLKALTTDAHPQPGLIVVHADLVDDVVEQVFEACDGTCGILVIGDPNKDKAGLLKSAKSNGVSVGWWEDIWEAGEKAGSSVEEASFSDVHGYFYSAGPDGKPVIAKVTHLNVTAGIAGLLSLFPASKRPSAGLKDVVASSVRLDTPLGMTIALAAIWSGAGYRFIGTKAPTWEEPNPFYAIRDFLEEDSSLPKPTILFASPKYHEAFLYRLHLVYNSNPLADWALANTVPSIHDGYVSKNGFYNWLVWGEMRKWVFQGLLGKRLRAMIIVGDSPAQESLLLSHLLLSMPITRLRDHPLSAGPIFNSHFYDLQVPSHPVLKAVVPSSQGTPSHSGPPAANIEVKLCGPGVETRSGAVAGSGDVKAASNDNSLKGTIWARGPAVLERIDGGGNIVEGWVSLEQEASVQPNGTFIVSRAVRAE